MATKIKIDPERLYRCVEPTSFTDDGVPVAIGRDTVLLGKHAWVQRLPHLFAIEGDPEDAARARAALTDPEEERAVHRMARQSDVRILETRMKAKRAVKLDVDGELRRIRKGELLDPSELICSLVPTAFERVTAEHQR